MAFAVDQAPITERLAEVQRLWLYVRSLESKDVPPVDTDEVKLIRGLLYVHLYGAFERSVTDSLVRYLEEIASLNILYQHFSGSFYPAALDSHFSSLRDSQQKWTSRVDFGRAMDSDAVCVINSNIFADQLQNVKSKALRNLSIYLGAAELYTPRREDELYLNEVVEKRNQVAHGRSSPMVIGSVGRAGDFLLRYQAIERILGSFSQMLESHYASRSFVREAYRELYQ